MSTDNDLAHLAATLAQLAHTLAAKAEHPEAGQEPERQMPERVLLTVEEAANYLGVGRTLMYRLIRDGEIETVQIHRLRRVPREAIDAYATRIQAEQNAA